MTQIDVLPCDCSHAEELYFKESYFYPKGLQNSFNFMHVNRLRGRSPWMPTPEELTKISSSCGIVH